LSFIAIKVFGGTELVGLDLEKVMEGIDEPTSEEIQSSIDAHTVGLVISFFDQRHGPVPIIVEPTILKDNFTKLVDLSDLSFSACRFAENFEEELPSNFDFNLGRGYKVTSVAFGFALDRPKARGGSENITLNILAQKTYSKLIIQFTEKFEDQVHDIHVTMNEKPKGLDEITEKVVALRNFVTKMVLSYENLYGPYEEESEEE
ncbi:MAG: hypothetical protein ACXAEU_19915, partial [Candidatus Hodarchaeales archaeon]